ncbi:MAG: TraR/DksA C4-type zinc finger protein [Sedimentisphaerales bacterium]|nr:TraR/DksA C4-type zinc finger protein [Sedimentisphaerales bacterium]
MVTKKKTATSDKSKKKTVKASASSKAASKKKVRSNSKSEAGAKKSADAAEKPVVKKKTATRKKTAVKKKTVSKKRASSAKKTVKARKSVISKVEPEALKVEPAIIEDPLTPEEIEELQRLLLEKRIELVGDVGHMHSEALDNNRQDSAGDLSNMPIHMADIGTDNYEQEFTLGLIESERKLLYDIDRALIKISEGTYGICEGTGIQINRARLEAKPEARYCIEYARKVESGLVRPEDLENGDTEIPA